MALLYPPKRPAAVLRWMLTAAFVFLLYQFLQSPIGQSLSQAKRANRESSAETAVRYVSVPYVEGFGRFTDAVTLLCGGMFVGYSNMFAHLRSVVVNPSRAKGRPGGEDINDVWNQDEKDEYFQFFPGYFSIPCGIQKPRNQFSKETHLYEWMSSLRPMFGRTDKRNLTHVKGMTLAVTRFSYANLYVQTVDIYNAFLVCKILQLDPRTVNILLIDGHPKGVVDDVWSTLFADVTRAGHLKRTIVYDNLIWGMPDLYSPLGDKRIGINKCPVLGEFVNHVLHQYALQGPKDLNCDDIQVLVVLRRDYVAHPRNPKGIIGRKIQNEDELLTSFQDVLDRRKGLKGSVKGVQLDTLRFRDQVELATQTDVLVGMHGAGLSHALYLPKHAGLIEIFPKGHTTISHFDGFAKFKSIHYQQYVSKNFENVHRYTMLDAEDIAFSLENMINRMC